MKLHPLAWWGCCALFAILVLHSESAIYATAISLAIAVPVVLSRESSYWHKSFAFTLRIAILLFIIRMTVGIVIGVPMPGRTLFRLPEIHLPPWLVGIRLGGDVTSQRLLTTFHECVILISLLIIFGAANALVSPRSLMKTFPHALYNVSTTILVATSTLPQLARSFTRIKSAQRLRGQSHSMITSWRKVSVPLLEESLERALELATAMEARGYGYQKNVSKYRPLTWTLSDSLLLTLALAVVVIFW